MTKQKNNIIPVELTQEEQEFENILTDKLIEVAHNPSMRKDFIVQASDTEQYRFYKEDIPSEIEHKALFLFNLVNGNYERALQWAEQAKDELVRHSMLSTYYHSCAIDAPQNAAETQSLYLQSFEHSFHSVYGIDCCELEEYAEYLAKSGNEVELIELAVVIFDIGLHRMNPADPDVVQKLNQECTRNEVELIQRVLQILKEYGEKGRKEVKDLFMDYYHTESAYFYACTGCIEKARKEVSMIDKESIRMYDFSNLPEQELEERHEAIRGFTMYPVYDLIMENSPHIQQMALYVPMAFGYIELPKRPRPKKGSFDWLYNQAEKGYVASLKDEATEQDYANMRTVAEAYRTGNGVRQNLRLADCWEEMAQP